MITTEQGLKNPTNMFAQFSLTCGDLTLTCGEFTLLVLVLLRLEIQGNLCHLVNSYRKLSDSRNMLKFAGYSNGPISTVKVGTHYTIYWTICRYGAIRSDKSSTWCSVYVLYGAPTVGSDVVWLAVHAAQSHDIKDIMRLAVRHQDIVPDRGTHCTFLTTSLVYIIPCVPNLSVVCISSMKENNLLTIVTMAKDLKE